LLLAESKKAIKFMIPMPRVPTVGANWREVNSTNILDEGLRIGEIRRRMNSQSNKVAMKVNVGVKPGLLSIWPTPSPPGPYI
jgi:hypothetical protein